jgi:hypothetical protein
MPLQARGDRAVFRKHVSKAVFQERALGGKCYTRQSFGLNLLTGVRMSEQSKRLAAQFEYAKNKHQVNDATGRQREQLLDEAFVSMRQELEEHLQKQCEELNHEPQIDNILVSNLVADPSGITRRDSGAFLSVKFDATLRKATFKCDEPARFKYVVEVKPRFNGRNWWYADKNGSSIGGHLESVAQEVIGALLEIDSKF